MKMLNLLLPWLCLTLMLSFSVSEQGQRCSRSDDSSSPSQIISKNCGNSPRNTDKIVGGENAGLGRWPWMVLIREGKIPCKFPFVYQSVSYLSCTRAGGHNLWCSTKTDGMNKHITGGGHFRECSQEEYQQQRQQSELKSLGKLDKWFCGGVLITDQFVLSAAHCFTNNLKAYVRIGEYDLNNDPDSEEGDMAPNHQDISVECVIKHQQYGKRPDNTNCRRCNDIALVKLATPATFMLNFVQPICLPHNPEAFDEGDGIGLSVEQFTEATAYATGWGITDLKELTRTKSKGSDILQEVVMNITDGTFCLNQKKKFPDPNMIICAGEGDGRDTCRGDSGGPLMISSELVTKWYVVGITSYGDTVCGAQGSQSVFTSVHYYKDWIIQNIKAHA